MTYCGKKEIETQIKYVKLDAGDVIVVPGEPRYFVREDIAFYLGIISTLASITALIISHNYLNRSVNGIQIYYLIFGDMENFNLEKIFTRRYKISQRLYSFNQKQS